MAQHGVLTQQLGLTADWKIANNPNSAKELEELLNDRNTIILRQDTPSASHAHNSDGVTTPHYSLNDNVFDNLDSTITIVDNKNNHTRKRPWSDSSYSDTDINICKPVAKLANKGPRQHAVHQHGISRSIGKPKRI